VTVLAILEYPDDRLRRVAVPVVRFDAYLHQLVDQLFETLAHSGGLGLAATQVDVHLRVLVTRVPGSEPCAYVNPEILERELPAIAEESCLSLPGLVAQVPRSARVRVRAYDRHGVRFERDLVDLEAVCLQHETEHLDGILFVDHLSWLRRFQARRRLGKARPAAAAAARGRSESA
jgi:peptide deformylase